jgi:hypothetical protein
MKPLPLYPGAKPCLRSGFCCEKAACPFGTFDFLQQRCRELEYDAAGQASCRRYDEIIAMPESNWAISPAFGAGCCMPLFNSKRDARALRLKETTPCLTRDSE